MKKKEFKIAKADLKLYDIDDVYIDIYRKNPKALKGYKELITKEFNKTGDLGVFLIGLKLIAKVEKKMALIAKKAKVDRTSIYRMLDKEANPSFNTVKIFSDNLGIKCNFFVSK
jgi:DNA-binding phage protein